MSFSASPALERAALTDHASGSEGSTTRQQNQLIWAFLILGLAARTIRYVLRFPLWEDEAFVCANLIDASYGDLLQPLNFHQVAPLLFLWTQLTLVKVLGFSEWPLRLVSFASGAASLFLFERLARRLLHGPALVLAVAVFAVSYAGIRYSAEAKPYGSDLLVSLVLVMLSVMWWQTSKARFLWILALLAPLAVGFSFPAAFIGGGVSLFVGYVLWSERRSGWLRWLMFNVLLCAAFALFYLLSARSQAASEGEFMGQCWSAAFPPLANPLRFLGWLVQVHTGSLLAYPIGGDNFASTLSCVGCLAGVVVLTRKRQGALLILVLAPFALNFVAAAAHRYPYGGHVKLAHYLAPAICLLLGLGFAALMGAWSRGGSRIRWQYAVACLLLAVLAAGSMARDSLWPYKSLATLHQRDFARWFWFSAPHEGELVCLKTDLGIDFSPATFSELSWSANYLCNQRIYSPRHVRGELPNWQRVSRDRPLRCVEYRDPRWTYDERGFEQWMDTMRQRFDLFGQETLAFPIYDKRERYVCTTDHLHVYTFVPKGSGTLPGDAVQAMARRPTKNHDAPPLGQ
jgi:hypothetical protein